MVTKYKIAANKIQPNTQNNQLVQQLAQNAANQQLQNQAQAQAEAVDPMRQTVNDLLKNKLITNVEMPKFTTIQDILDAPKGSKLETFGKYIGNNPDVTRLIGTVFGGTVMDNNGNFVSAGENTARRQEALMQAEQQKALSQIKEQNDIATALNNMYMHKDIADENNKRMVELAKMQNEWQKEKFEREQALEREKMYNALQRAYLIHGGSGSGSSGGGLATGGASGVNNAGGINLNNIKMTAAERKALTENKTTLANIESGLKALEENPNAYQWYKGILGPDVANRIDPKGVGTRTQIDNITAVYRKWLTGAQMSDKERKAYERFLPAPTDNYNIVKAKLEGMRGAVSRSNDAILSNYGITNIPVSTGNKPKRIY